MLCDVPDVRQKEMVQYSCSPVQTCDPQSADWK